MKHAAEELGENFSERPVEAQMRFAENAHRGDLAIEILLKSGEAIFINDYEILHGCTGF